jgi:D-hydroxyproline dehydrogenase subunit beta
MSDWADVAVVGGGIVGLAQAWSAAKRGLSVVLFERDPRAQGASVRNFGMIWPIGLPAGPLREAALSSRRLWQEIAAETGIWHDPCGSLHLAYAADEMAMLSEFAEAAPALGYEVALLEAAAVRRLSAAVNVDGLLGGLWSPTEMAINPRQAVAVIPRWLRERFGARLCFGTTIQRIDLPNLDSTDGRRWRVGKALVCGGADFHTLFPDVFAQAGLRRCKLQMMRTAPQPEGWRMGPMIACGLTLRHYQTFARCPSLARLQQRIAAESPELDRFGIHVMAAQNDRGEVVLGDSHEYDEAIEPFDKCVIDELILGQVRRLICLPAEHIASRWHGIYAKHSTLAEFVAQPRPGVTIVVNTCGLGMTLSFGLAEQGWQARMS